MIAWTAHSTQNFCKKKKTNPQVVVEKHKLLTVLKVHAITQAYEMAHSKQYEINQMKKELMQRANLQDRPRNVVSPLIQTESGSVAKKCRMFHSDF